jgi:exoribonuclease-2
VNKWRETEKGTWVHLFQLLVEGKLVRGFEGLDVGDQVHIELIGTDVGRGFTYFSQAAHLTDSALNPFIYS